MCFGNGVNGEIFIGMIMVDLMIGGGFVGNVEFGLIINIVGVFIDLIGMFVMVVVNNDVVVDGGVD